MAHFIFLTGFMGCGKTHFGLRLSTQLGYDFIDTDQRIEQFAGITISEIFKQKGEEWFRQTERNIIEQLGGQQRNAVVALGGGAACTEGVMEMLNQMGDTVYIRMTPYRLLLRLGEKARAKRPKIKGLSDRQLLDYINETLPQREKYYTKAKYTFDCAELSDTEVVDELIRQLSSEN